METTKKPTVAELAESTRAMMTIAGVMAEHAADIAHARRVLFQAYLSEGFTEPQALELCKSFLLT